MKTELKPCPFCNSTAKLKKGNQLCGHNERMVYYYVECETCKSRTSNCDDWYGTKTTDAITKAITLWNKRADTESEAN